MPKLLTRVTQGEWARPWTESLGWPLYDGGWTQGQGSLSRDVPGSKEDGPPPSLSQGFPRSSVTSAHLPPLPAQEPHLWLQGWRGCILAPCTQLLVWEGPGFWAPLSAKRGQRLLGSLAPTLGGAALGSEHGGRGDFVGTY